MNSLFRVFLRLGNPLNCEKIVPPSANISSCYSPVPLARVKSLVSTTTPKSFSHSASIHQSQTFSTGARPTPAFVEFDMSAEGFGCLFLPSLAPHNFQSGSEIGNGSILGSGIGMGERVFPGNCYVCFVGVFCARVFNIILHFSVLIKCTLPSCTQAADVSFLSIHLRIITGHQDRKSVV